MPSTRVGIKPGREESDQMRKILGVLLVAAGAIGLAVGAIEYTTEEQVLDAGPIEASVETQERIPIPPVAGGIAVALGVVLLLTARKES